MKYLTDQNLTHHLIFYVRNMYHHFVAFSKIQIRPTVSSFLIWPPSHIQIVKTFVADDPMAMALYFCNNCSIHIYMKVQQFQSLNLECVKSSSSSTKLPLKKLYYTLSNFSGFSVCQRPMCRKVWIVKTRRPWFSITMAVPSMHPFLAGLDGIGTVDGQEDQMFTEG